MGLAHPPVRQALEVDFVPSQPLRNLDHETGVAVKRGPRATRSVQSLGTSANAAPGPKNPEWWADLEYVWRIRTHDALQRLHKRARSQRRAELAATREARLAYERGDQRTGVRWGQRRVTLARSSEWAEHRAQALALPRADVVGACGKRWRQVACACGTRDVPVGCDQCHLCAKCRTRHWRKWRKKIVRAMDAHLNAARGSWAARRRRGELVGMMPGVYLVTLTIQHSGSIQTDRERMAKAWRALSKVANAGGWWGAYALTYEVTPGTRGDGHVHIHLAAISSWIPYEELHETWRRVSGARVLDVSAPGRSKGAKSAAEYLSKYVTKGVDPADFTGQKAGELICAWRGKRKITTSKGFWMPIRDRETRCQTCGQHHRMVRTPGALVTVAPAAVLRALAERVGWWIPRGAQQMIIGGFS